MMAVGSYTGVDTSDIKSLPIERYLTSAELIAVLNAPDTHLRHWMRRGLRPAFRLEHGRGRAYRWLLSDVVAWLREHNPGNMHDPRSVAHRAALSASARARVARKRLAAMGDVGTGTAG